MGQGNGYFIMQGYSPVGYKSCWGILESVSLSFPGKSMVIPVGIPIGVWGIGSPFPLSPALSIGIGVGVFNFSAKMARARSAIWVFMLIWMGGVLGYSTPALSKRLSIRDALIFGLIWSSLTICNAKLTRCGAAASIRCRATSTLRDNRSFTKGLSIY